MLVGPWAVNGFSDDVVSGSSDWSWFVLVLLVRCWWVLMKLRLVWSVSWLVRGGSCVLVMVVCRCMGGCWYGLFGIGIHLWIVGVCACVGLW